VQEFTWGSMTSALILLNADMVTLVLTAFVMALPTLLLVTFLHRAPDNIAMVPVPPPLLQDTAIPIRWSLTAGCAIPVLSIVPIPPLVLMAFVLVPTPNKLVELVLCLLPPLL